MTYLVQSVIFDKSKFSLENARIWLLENKYKDKGVDEKKKFWRFRQLNPLTIKRKGYTHYITKPLDASGIELIIAYKEKMEGAGKLNQIKKALFKHFKADEKLEKQTASTLTRATKDADDLLHALIHHDKKDDKPQSQIKKSISKLNKNILFGKGVKDKSSIYSKDKMTTQEAKLYMSGIMTTGGALDASQDVAFRLKNSFKVGELRKMMRELLAEGRITVSAKEISKMKKDAIISMIVQGQLANPPELPPTVAVAKKYKLADLKREVLEHAGLGKLKKDDILKYIETHQLWSVHAVVPEAQNISMTIEETAEPDVLHLEESLPSGNPKLQMKGIKIGTREMPKEAVIEKQVAKVKSAKKQTDTQKFNELLIKSLSDTPKVKGAKPQTLNEKLGLSERIVIPSDLSTRHTAKDMKRMGATKNDLPDRHLELDLPTLKIIDEYLQELETGKVTSFTDDHIKEIKGDMDQLSIDYRYEFKQLPQKKPTKAKKSKKLEGEVIIEEDITADQIPEFKIKEYMDKGYAKPDAVEAVMRDLKYDRKIMPLLSGKSIEDVTLPPKPLTAKENGDERERVYIAEKTEEAKKDPKLKAIYLERQRKLFENGAIGGFTPNLMRVMIFENFPFEKLNKAIKFLDDEVRGHSQSVIAKKVAEAPKVEASVTPKKTDAIELVKPDFTEAQLKSLLSAKINSGEEGHGHEGQIQNMKFQRKLFKEFLKDGKIPNKLTRSDTYPKDQVGPNGDAIAYVLYKKQMFVNPRTEVDATDHMLEEFIDMINYYAKK